MIYCPVAPYTVLLFYMAGSIGQEIMKQENRKQKNKKHTNRKQDNTRTGN